MHTPEPLDAPVAPAPASPARIARIPQPHGEVTLHNLRYDMSSRRRIYAALLSTLGTDEAVIIPLDAKPETFIASACTWIRSRGLIAQFVWRDDDTLLGWVKPIAPLPIYFPLKRDRQPEMGQSRPSRPEVEAYK